jgi:hypothetical protein
MDAGKLSEARRKFLEERRNEVKNYRRRADTPEDHIAIAEFEHELIEIEKRWERAGLINGQEELPLAAEAPTQR